LEYIKQSFTARSILCVGSSDHCGYGMFESVIDRLFSADFCSLRISMYLCFRRSDHSGDTRWSSMPHYLCYRRRRRSCTYLQMSQN